MRQWEPYASKLNDAGVSGVEDAACDAKVSHCIAVQQQVASRDADDERDESKGDSGQRDGHYLFPFRGPYFEIERRQLRRALLSGTVRIAASSSTPPCIQGAKSPGTA